MVTFPEGYQAYHAVRPLSIDGAPAFGVGDLVLLKLSPAVQVLLDGGYIGAGWPAEEQRPPEPAPVAAAPPPLGEEHGDLE